MPVDPRLPDGGGNTINGFVDRNRNTATLAPNNLFTLARDYGDQIQQWNGVDLTMNARVRPDLYVQGGVSTGRTLTDNCEILAKMPESNPLGLPYCRQLTNFLTQVKFLGFVHRPTDRGAAQWSVSKHAGTRGLRRTGRHCRRRPRWGGRSPTRRT